MTSFSVEVIVSSILEIAMRSSILMVIAALIVRYTGSSASHRRTVWTLALLVVTVTTLLTAGSAATNLLRGAPNTSTSMFIGEASQIQIVIPAAPAPVNAWLARVLVIFAIGTTVSIVRSMHASTLVRRTVRSATAIDDPSLLVVFANVCRQAGLKTAPQLRQSNEIETAALYGMRHPTIVLSTNWKSWNEPRLTQVLHHEIAHLTGRDLERAFLARSIRTVYWWNPLVGRATQQLALEQEFACDEQVVLNGNSAASYAETLLDLARASSARMAATGVGITTPLLPQRVEAVLRFDGMLVPRPSRWRLLAPIAAFVLIAAAPFPDTNEHSAPSRVVDLRGQKPETRRIVIDRDASGNVRVDSAR